MLNAMPSKPRIYATVFILTVIAGCTGYHETGEGELDGDVFIVTQGAENVKLGLVEVKVLPYEESKNSIAKTRAQAEREIADLQPGLDAARKALESAQARMKAAKAEANAATNRFESLSFDDPRNGAASEASSDAIDRLTAAIRAFDAAEHAASEREKPFQRWNSGALYFASLPSPVASVKTDADGKFSIPLDRKNTVVLAACATRRVADKIENYYWLVAVSLDGQPSKRIFLSNDNLATADSKDSLIHVVE